MQIQFLAIPPYVDRIIQVHSSGAPLQTGDARLPGTELKSIPPWIGDAAQAAFAAVDDTLMAAYELDYNDNGLGNTLYRLEGERQQMCLKILGKTPGNLRELEVWRYLGFGQESNEGFKPIKGLPPVNKIFLQDSLNMIFMPFYKGSLKPIGGGQYPLPLVHSVILYLMDTLEALHHRGIAYMDLCPSNILYSETPGGFLLFFLADMGGVKPLVSASREGRPIDKLANAVTETRWTRREVMPPENLFPLNADDARFEKQPAYDYFALARTAMVMLGLGDLPLDEEPGVDLFQDDFNLEDLMAPRRSEIRDLRTELASWLEGNTGGLEETRERFISLFTRFFIERADLLHEMAEAIPDVSEQQDRLAKTLLRYRAGIGPKVYKTLATRLSEIQQATHNLDAVNLGTVNQIPQLIIDGDRDACVAALEATAQSRLVRLSPTVNYAWHYHRKLARTLWGRACKALDQLDVPRLKMLDDDAESTALRTLRRHPDTEMGILTRTL